MYKSLMIIILATASACIAGVSGTAAAAEHAQQSRLTSRFYSMPPADRAALELGHKVLAVIRALENPGAPGAMDAVSALGHDQRYYVLVRGWLSFQLQGDASILEANGPQTRQSVKDRIRFLEQAIRLLDLE